MKNDTTPIGVEVEKETPEQEIERLISTVFSLLKENEKLRNYGDKELQSEIERLKKENAKLKMAVKDYCHECMATDCPECYLGLVISDCID